MDRWEYGRIGERTRVEGCLSLGWWPLLSSQLCHFPGDCVCVLTYQDGLLWYCCGPLYRHSCRLNHCYYCFQVILNRCESLHDGVIVGFLCRFDTQEGLTETRGKACYRYTDTPLNQRIRSYAYIRWCKRKWIRLTEDLRILNDHKLETLGRCYTLLIDRSFCIQSALNFQAEIGKVAKCETTDWKTAGKGEIEQEGR